LKNDSTIKGHSDFIYYCEFSRDGKQIVSCGKESEIFIWDVKKGRNLVKTKGQSECIYTARFSPDNKILFTSETHGWIQAYDASSLKNICRIKLPNTDKITAYSIDFNFSGPKPLIYVALDDETFRVLEFNGSSLKQIYQTHAHCDGIRKIKYLPERQELVTSSKDGGVKLWDSKYYEFKCNLVNHKDHVVDIDWHPQRPNR